MRRPSPALIVACIALIAACAGSATAASLITGAQIRNGSVTGADVRDRSLRGRDVRSNSISGRNVRGLSGRDVIRNGLDGSDIDENTLETVPRATNATRAETAVGADTAVTAETLARARVTRVRYVERPSSPSAVVYDQGGLRITAVCSPAGRLTATATPTAAGGLVRVTVTHPGTPAETRLQGDNDFSGTDAVDLVAGGASGAAGRLVHTVPTGEATTIDYLAHEGSSCTLAGSAVHTLP